MTDRTALVVSEPEVAATELAAALGEADMAVTSVRPAGLPDLLPDLGEVDLVLLAASLDVEQAQGLVTQLTERGVHPTAFLVFADHGLDQLGGHVGKGLDYVLPPFRADLLRGRLLACRGQVELDKTVQELQAATQMIKYERELQIGREIQEGFLPDSLPVPDGWEIEARFTPAREVAGDFYDGFTMVGGRRLGFIIADVCDKGVGAALFMALIRSLLRNTASHGGSLNVVGLDVQMADSADGDGVIPSGVTTAGVAPLMHAVAGTNDYLTENHLEQGYFATMFFGVLDPTTGSLLYMNCGHNPPVIRRADGEQILLPPTGPALGMLPGSTFALGRTQLDLGDTLFLYTDGVTEAKDVDGLFFTEARVTALLAEPMKSAEDLVERVETGLHDHIGAADQFDDITMMVLYRSATPTSSNVPGADLSRAPAVAPGADR